MKKLTIFRRPLFSVIDELVVICGSNSGWMVCPQTSGKQRHHRKDLAWVFVVNQDGKVIGEIQAVNFVPRQGRIISVTSRNWLERKQSCYYVEESNVSVFR